MQRSDSHDLATDDPVRIDRSLSAARISEDVETLGGSPYASSEPAICRYAFTPEYRRTLDYISGALSDIGFRVWLDPVGNLIARNCADDVEAVGVGSHCDSIRAGGKFDGTLGVVAAVELARVNRELGLDVPLQVMAFVEEEGSGFGQGMLGSRIMAGRVTEEDLHAIKAIDDGGSFWDHAIRAGLDPSRWRESARALDHLRGWIELHIEQGRVLEDSALRLGVVEAIVGLVHADIRVEGRPDHAGATPMNLRHDAGVVAAAAVVELERLALAAGGGLVATVGELSLEPGLINVIPGSATFSIDVRGSDARRLRDVVDAVIAFVTGLADGRGMQVSYEERTRSEPVHLSPILVEALSAVASGLGVPHRRMTSGAGHDTICVSDHVPSAMLFVPCVGGLSHSPLEHADAGDAALGVEVMLNAMRSFAAPAPGARLGAPAQKDSTASGS